MKIIRFSFLAVVAALSQASSAQPVPRTEESVVTAPGTASVTRTIKATATVVGIEPETRMVTLKESGGKTLSVEAGDEVRNFEQIRVGDRVTAEYRQALSLDLKKGSAGIRESAERPITSRAPPGAKPKGEIGREVRILADVVAVNPKSKAVTLRGPQGNLLDLMVEDPAQLKNVKEGDQVQAVYTEAVAVSVAAASSTSGK